MNTGRVVTIAALIQLSASVIWAQPKPCVSTAVGDLRVESLESAVYGDRRTVRILLPAGYDDKANAARTYPVLYMFDGQTLFDACTAFSGEGELQIDETVMRLIGEGAIGPLIVIGIDSSTRRSYEYRPYKDTVADPTAPDPIGEKLPPFIGTDVLPYVRTRYRVTRSPAETGIGGTSLGAIAALYVLLQRGDLFGIGLLQSPTLPLGNGQLLRDTELLARGPDRIYIGVGTAELPSGIVGDRFAAELRISSLVANAGFARMAETLAANLKGAYLNHPEVTLVVEPNANHSSASWARRFPNAIKALYGPLPH